eukprot:jgi/Orpsp1_1/1174401/evm.model.c7180000049960.1
MNNENNNNYKLINVNDKNIKYINNTSESHGNNYATDPYMINLLTENIENITLKSGDLFPLKFNIIDEFDQIIEDMSKLYSNIILKMDIENLDENNKKNIKLIGNMCFYSKGMCELNNFKIFAIDPSNFNLKLNLENEKIKIKFSKEKFDITIENCGDKQIKIMDKSKFYYCENPICDDSCPVLNGTSECLKSEKENINSVSLNKCQCLPGWNGNRCENRDFIEYKN